MNSQSTNSITPIGHSASFSQTEAISFRRAPVFIAVLCLSCGILSDRFFLPHWQLPAIRCAVVIALALITWCSTIVAPRVQLFAVYCVWLTLGWTLSSIEVHAPASTSINQYADGLSRQIRGTVTHIQQNQTQSTSDSDTSPSEFFEEEPSPSQLWSIDLNINQIEEVTPDISRMVPMQGGVRLLWHSNTTPQLHCGDELDLPVRLLQPQRYRDPGVWQYADYLAENNINLQAVTRATQLHIIPATRISFSCRLQSLQLWMTQRLPLAANTPLLHKLPRWLRLSSEDTGALNAMLLGYRSQLHKQLRLHFERTGTFHLLVVAGLHIGLIAALLLWILQRLGLTRLQTTLIAIPILFAYALLTGFGDPVQRALYMTVIFLIVRAVSRRSSTLNALGFALLAMLAFKPSSLFEASLQMTALAVIAIGSIGHALAERTFLPYLRASRQIHRVMLDTHFHPRLAQYRVQLRLLASAISSPLLLQRVILNKAQSAESKGLLLARSITNQRKKFVTTALAWSVRFTLLTLELVLLSVISELCMSLPMMYYFHRLTPLALPANILCIVLIGPLMATAALFMLAACIHPLLAALPAIATAILLHLAEVTIRFFSLQSIADIRTPLPDLSQIVAMLAAIALCTWAVRQKKMWLYTGLITLLATFIFLLLPLRAPNHQDALEITAIDVGQGDSLLMVAPNGSTMLIDAGGPVGRGEEERISSFDIGEEVVSPYLWQRGIRHLDSVTLTHAHSDHMGGMASVVRNFRPRELWLSAQPDSQMLQQLLGAAREIGTQVRFLHQGDSTLWNEVQLNVLAPATITSNNAPSNDDSLVLHAQWQQASALLEGDAEKKSEDAMLQHPQLLPSQLLKVGHHGSRTSTSPEFLHAVAPTIALISSGRDNHFGHPRMEVLQRLQAQHVRVLRTDMLGASTVYLKSNGAAEVSTAPR